MNREEIKEYKELVKQLSRLEKEREIANMALTEVAYRTFDARFIDNFLLSYPDWVIGLFRNCNELGMLLCAWESERKRYKAAEKEE
ncbi:hypothetical protein [Faecalibaculum rodentium]|uniref:hypothetical protein n=1 Tax=Faecalibaculum rodentium TaxID=1702221 RepID=UPI00272A74EB|nr:hypothetical protein [Faecalibaculum rodentium]